MIVIAHVAGVPLEEMLPALAAAGSAGLLLVRGRLLPRLRRRREPGR